MTGSLALLVVLVLLGSLSAAENDDSLISPFSREEMTSVIDGLVRERMAGIESGLKNDISVLKNANEALKSGFELLEVENSALKSGFEFLEVENRALRSGFELLEEENRQLKSKVDSIENELEIVKAAASKKPPDLNDIQADHVSRRVASYHPSASQVAFLARLTHALTDVGHAQTITFDAVEINVGNNYNPATSVFTCGSPGLYVFHLTIMLEADKYAELRFMKNGNTWHNFYTADKDFYGTGSTTTLIQLDQGDTVWIKADQFHSPGTLVHQHYCYFSGFLLYPTI